MQGLIRVVTFLGAILWIIFFAIASIIDYILKGDD